jgi:hypothetical protein
LQPLQLSLHICGNISSNIALVNQAEMPLPLGSGHPEFSAAHLVAGGVRVVADAVVDAGVVVAEGVVVGTVGVRVVASTGVVVGTTVVWTGAEQRA